MWIRNCREYDQYLPYAGKKRGLAVKAGKLSIELPTDRFFDPLLQRDWKLGKIEVLLSQLDKAVLGPVAADLQSEEVQVDYDTVVPAPGPAVTKETPKPAPERTKMSAETGEQTPDVPKTTKPRGNGSPGIGEVIKSGITKRAYTLAQELNVSSRALIAELQSRGYKIKAAQTNLTEEQIELMTDHFTANPPAAMVNAPKPGPLPAGIARGMRTTGSAHEVPAGIPGMPSVRPQSGAPSLADLAEQNARITLGQPKFGESKPGAKATIEVPGQSQFGSTLSTGVADLQKGKV